MKKAIWPACVIALIACRKGSTVEARPTDPCDTRAEGELRAKGTVTCACGAIAGTSPGSVRGTGTYSWNSSLCVAAVHAGAIPAAGGEITAKLLEQGCPAYAGSTRNGVTTNDDAWVAPGFYFPSTGEPKCAPAPKLQTEGPCPATFENVQVRSWEAQITCDCDKAAAPGKVIGSRVYARDSSICGAATHAGVIPKSEGRVTVHATRDCASFVGSTENGIRSQASPRFYTKTGWAFYFPGHGNGECAPDDAGH